jgi:hypothetical protein
MVWITCGPGRRFSVIDRASKAAALGIVSWAKGGPVWLMRPCYRTGRSERSRLMIMPV